MHEHADDNDGRMHRKRRKSQYIGHNGSCRSGTQRDEKIVHRAFSEEADHNAEYAADKEGAQRIDDGSAEKQRKEKRTQRGGSDDKGD